MNAIVLTVFVGFVLVGFFVLMFLAHRRDAEGSSPERDSLMPLEEDAWCVPDGTRRPGPDDRPGERLTPAVHS